MITQPFARRLPSRKSGFKSAFLNARVAFAACALLAIAVPSVKAQNAAVTGSCQKMIEAYLTAHYPGTNVVTSSSTELATAVAQEIKANTNKSLTPADFAESAILPYPYGTTGATGTTRSNVSPTFNRDAAAALVTGSAVAQVILTGTGPGIAFNNEIAAIVDTDVDVGGTTAARDLTDNGKTLVISHALTALTNSYQPASSGIRADIASATTIVGETLLHDSALEALSGKEFTTILENAMPGVTGTNAGIAPNIANDFVTGLITSSSNTFTWPNASQGATSSTFAVAILTQIASSYPADSLISHTIGSKIYNNNSSNEPNLISFSKALFTAFPTSRAAVETSLSIGLVASVTQGSAQENLREAFIQNLTGAEVGSYSSIEQGSIYVDPYYASNFTSSVLAGIHATTSGSTKLIADAPTVATEAGVELGADGNVLTHVAGVFANYLANGSLSATNAGAYATDMIQGAETSNVAAFGSDKWGNGGGGKLNLAQGGISSATVMDLASITDLLADGIVRLYGSSITTSANATKAANAIGALAEAVAKFTKDITINDSHSATDSVSVFIAATLDNYIVSLPVGSAETTILNAIKTDVEAVCTFDNQINAEETDAEAKNGTDKYAAITGAIGIQETTVTNL